MPYHVGDAVYLQAGVREDPLLEDEIPKGPEPFRVAQVIGDAWPYSYQLRDAHGHTVLDRDGQRAQFGESWLTSTPPKK